MVLSVNVKVHRLIPVGFDVCLQTLVTLLQDYWLRRKRVADAKLLTNFLTNLKRSKEPQYLDSQQQSVPRFKEKPWGSVVASNLLNPHVKLHSILLGDGIHPEHGICIIPSNLR